MPLTAGKKRAIKKTEFRAKDVKDMLKIKGQRYSYILAQSGIQPEGREVVGRGSYHKFSLKNAVQFAIAHRLSAMGLPPAVMKFILDHINKVDEENGIGIYDPKVRYLEYRLNIYNEANPPLLHFDGNPPDHILEELRKRIGLSGVEDFEAGLKHRISSFNDSISYMGEPEIFEMNPGEYYEQRESAEEWFYVDFEGYMTLNLEPIRSKVFGYASR